MIDKRIDPGVTPHKAKPAFIIRPQLAQVD